MRYDNEIIWTSRPVKLFREPRCYTLAITATVVGITAGLATTAVAINSAVSGPAAQSAPANGTSGPTIAQQFTADEAQINSLTSALNNESSSLTAIQSSQKTLEYGILITAVSALVMWFFRRKK